MTRPALIALAGNPNVGKSTIFNALTGLHQHTGNWPGKTVVNSHGSFFYHKKRFQLIDLPGIYSMDAPTAEEAVTADFIRTQRPDLIVVVLDASCLERNLPLAMQIITTAPNVIICVNLLDEAANRNIRLDLPLLSRQLGAAVIGTSAGDQQGLADLKAAIYNAVQPKENVPAPGQQAAPLPPADSQPAVLYQRAEQIVRSVSISPSPKTNYTHWLDDIFTSRLLGFPLMILLLLLIFFLTLHLANYPSRLLSEMFTYMQAPLSLGLLMYGIPSPIHDMLIYGVYRTLSWVIAVMLPPMAIFFPLFTLLEDFGYLPRVAFNLDQLFKKCHTCGKQSLTSCMALGCNAAGVIACRIIDSPRERLIAILTNNFIPCNGRMPLYLTLSSIFICALFPAAISSFLPALCITLLIACGIIATLISAWLLSHTLLQGTPSTNIIELPPYRMPRFTSVLYHSLIERTLFVLKRAVIVAAPAGLIIWLLANISWSNTTLLNQLAVLLDPAAHLIGLDGYILLAFILALPANEIFLPILLMAYLNAGQLLDFSSLSDLRTILLQHHWTVLTAVNVMLFSLFHWPCSTTLLTIYRETKSVKWPVLSCILPTLWGISLCALTTFIFRHC